MVGGWGYDRALPVVPETSLCVWGLACVVSLPTCVCYSVDRITHTTVCSAVLPPFRVRSRENGVGTTCGGTWSGPRVIVWCLCLV